MSSKTPDPLGTARQLFQKARFQEVVSLLEAEVFRYRDNFEYYSLLGLASLQLSDWSGAETYLKRSSQISPSDAEVLFGLALVDLARNRIPEALKGLLKVQEVKPAHKGAQQALQAIRKYSDSGDLLRWVNQTALKSQSSSRWSIPRPVWWVLSGLVAVGLLIGSVLAGPGLWAHLPAFSNGPSEVRPGSEALSLANVAPLTVFTGKTDFLYTESQIREVFNLAKEFFQKYQDNLAVRELNRLLLSNASDLVKDKAKVFKTLIQKPDFISFKDNFSLNEVRDRPKLYEDCFVKWKGAVANLNAGKQVVDFDFLVGYHEGKVLEGIVHVRLFFPVLIKNGQNLEILGQVKLTDNGGWQLEGGTIHELGFRGQEN